LNPSLKSEFSAKKTHWLSHWVGILVPYGLSVVAVAAAMGLRIVLTAMFGPGLPAYITFYPMVMAVALLSGFGPGLMAMAISVGIAMYYILPPTGQFAVASPIDRVGLVIYLGMGLFMSIVAEFYRRYRAKALVYDNEMKLRESQQALRDSEERNQLIVGHTRDYAIFMLDPQGRIATWNPGAERIKGYQAEEIIGQHFSCFYHKEAVASDWPAQELQIAEAEGRCEDVGWRIRKDGSRFWADVIITRLLDDAGHLKGFSKITRDLTQKKQAEELLNDSKRRIEGILESAMDAIISVYADQRIVLFNAAAEKIFRCAANEAIGTSVERFIPIRARSAHAAHIRRFAETGTTSRAMGQLGNIMGLRVDGSEFPIEASISQAEASGKKIFTVILRDITESKLVEETLHKAAAFNEAALRSLGEGLYTIDDKGLVTSMNPAAEELFGWSLAELRGKKMHDMTHHHYPDGRPFPACECAGFQVLTNGMPLKDHEDVFIRKDGTFFAVTYSIAPLRDASGQINGLVVVFQDITERKRAEKALRENREDFIRAQEVGQIGWWRMDTTKNVLTWSDESYCIFGVPKGTPLTYESFLNCVHPDDRDYVHTQWMEGLTGVPYDLEHRIVVGSAVKWVREKAYLEFGEDGMLLGGFGVTQDITERKQAEDALKVSERLQRFLALIGELAVRSMMDTELLEGICAAVAGELSVSRCGFARVDLAAGQITVVHDYHSQLPSLAGRYPMVGYADYLEDGQVGCTVLFADLATDPRTAAFYEEGFAPIHVRAHLTVPLLRNGQWVANFWVSHHEPRLWTVAESELMRVIADRVWSFVENKRVEEKLRESELLLRTATDNAAVGLVMLDRNRHYVFANPAYCDILGLELNADELIGMSPAEVLAPVYTTQVSSRLDRAFRGECVSYELMRPGPDNGDSLYYVVVYDPKHDGADVVDGVIVTIFDITLRKQAENALRESQEDFVRAQEAGKLGWWRMDTVNNVLTFSGESYRIFGIPQGTPLTYESFLATLHPEDHDYVHTRWSAALKGELYDVEYRILADGVTKWVRAKS
jgi:PAS domain S-box-containing protein